MNLREFSERLFLFHKSVNDIKNLEELCKETQDYLFREYDNIDESEFSKVNSFAKYTPKDKKAIIREKLKKFTDDSILRIKESKQDFTAVSGFYDLLFKDNGELRYEGCCTTIGADTDFYRVRSASGYKLYNQSELFIVPYEKERFVGQGRYNQPGSAHLYLASTLYLAWEECRRPDFVTVNFSRYVNKKSLRVLDLTISSSFTKYGNFVMAFLALLCSAKTNDDDKYKFQYVVPDLMMKLLLRSQHDVRDSSKRYVGIKYISSRRYECSDFLFNGRYPSDAYVFPQQQANKAKVEDSDSLNKLFKMTDPRSYFLYKLHRLDFDAGSARISDYKNSLFHQLEAQLQNEKLKDIT
jgi:hypothetical protein